LKHFATPGKKKTWEGRNLSTFVSDGTVKNSPVLSKVSAFFKEMPSQALTSFM